MVYLSKYFKLPEVAKFWESVVTLNNWHQNRVSRLIVDKLFGTLSGKKIAVLGFSFKANTNDTRESAAIQICKNLIDEGAILHIHDPKVESKQIAKDLNKEPLTRNSSSFELDNIEGGNWIMAALLDEVFVQSDAVLILTEWDFYSKIDWQIESKKMRSPAWVFDSRSIVNQKKVIDAGLNFWRIGDGSRY